MAKVSRLDVALSSPWARAVAALIVATAAGAGVWWLYGWFRHDLGEPVYAWAVAIAGVALTLAFTGATYRLFGPRRGGATMTLAVVGDRAVAALRLLPEGRYYRQSLGDPWPVAVVGPTGGFVVWPRTFPESLRMRDGAIVVGGRPADPFADVRRVRDEVARRFETRGAALEATALVVVDSGAVIPPALHAGHRGVRVVHVDDLAGAVTFGPQAPSDVVGRAVQAVGGLRA